MRGQHPGFSQTPPRQRPGFDDMQSWQQQLMFKQLQEFQRQQQLRQPCQEQKQQNLTNQMLGLAKQTAVSQLPALVNGTSLHDVSNYSWQSELTGSEPKIPSTAQMFMAGNSVNLAQHVGSAAMHGYSNGVMLSQDQGHSMGFVPQQVDQSLYGVPVSGSRGSLDQYTQFQGMPQDFSDAIANAGLNPTFSSFQGNQNVYPDQGSLQENFIATKPDMQGKRMFGQIAVDNEKNSASGNFEQVSTSARSPQVQEFPARQNQSVWQGSSQEKEATRGSGSVSVGLDPTEQKILFSSDDDTNWDSSFGMTGNMMSGGYLHGNPLESNELFSSFQGGSWSALMQSAVAEVSSSDTGLQDEWSGLTFQKINPPSGNHTSIMGDAVKQKTGWFDNNIKGTISLPSRHVSTFDNCDASDHKTAAFQQSAAKFSSSQSERPHVVASQESLRQSSADFSSQNMHPSITEQQNISSYTSDIPFNNKGGTWNASESRSSNAGASFKVSSIESSMQHGHMNDSMRNMYADRPRGTSLWSTDSNQANASIPNSVVGLEPIKSGISSPQMRIGAVMDMGSSKHARESNQHGFIQHDFDQGKLMLLDSSQNSKGAVTLGDSHLVPSKSPQAWESFVTNSHKVSGDTYDREHAHGSQKELSNESYISNHSHHDHSSDSGGVARGGADSRSFVANHHKSQSQAGQQIPIHQRFHYHPMGNMGMVAEASDPQKQTLYTQGLSRMASREFTGQDQGYAQHTITSNTMDVDKNDINGPQVNTKGTAEMHATSNMKKFKGSANFDGSAFTFPQTKISGQASQNMLELLHKVDQSRGDAVAGFGFAGETMMSSRNEPMVSDDNSNLLLNQNSSLQGIGLRLAPPSGRASVPTNASSSHFSSQTINEDAGPRHPESGDQRRAWSNSAVPVQSSPLIHDTSRRDDCNDQSAVSRQTSKETLESKMRSNFMAQSSANPSHDQNKFQQEQVSGANMHISRDHSVKSHFGNQLDSEIHAKHALYHKQPRDSLDTVVNGSSQASLPGLPGRVPPFRLASPPDIRSNVGQPSYPGSIVAQPPQVNSGSNIRNCGQQIPMSEKHIAAQPSLSSGTTQQLGLSGTLRNVWTNISAQRLSNSLLQKAIPNSMRSINPNNLSTSSWVSQKTDFQDHNKGGHGSPNFGASSVHSQNQNYAESQPGEDGFKQPVPPGKVGFSSPSTSAPGSQEQLAKQASDGSSPFASSSFVQLDQKDREKQAQSSLSNQQREQLTQNREAPAFMLKPSDVQNRNYSLLQQVQAMKALEADPNSRIGKRLKGTDFSATATAPGKVPQTPQAIYGYSGGVRGTAENELSAVVQCSSFPSDARMLSFSSGGREGLNASKTTEVPGRELSSPDVGNNSGPSDSQSNPHTMGITSSPFSSEGGAEHARVSPQMAPSWFGQYGSIKSGNMLAMYSGHGNLQKDAKPAGNHYLIPKDTNSMNSSDEIVRKNNNSQIGYEWQNACPAAAFSSQISSHQTMSSGISDPNVIPRPMKRKSVELLPWYKEVTGGSHWMQSIRLAEIDWAKATNRLVEKSEDESEMNDEGSLLLRPRRRLILTTQLMQQLLPSIPADVLSKPAIMCCEKVIYLVAKLCLGDACGFVSYLGNDARGSPDAENMTSGKSKISERWGEQRFTKILDNFLGRAKKLETDLMRFDKRTSILDIRVECQDLERFSIINRFAKFHGRSQTDGVESSSTSETVRKSFPQRYVTALSVPIKLPEGVVCLSL